jgi:hypothetical protein
LWRQRRPEDGQDDALGLSRTHGRLEEVERSAGAHVDHGVAVFLARGQVDHGVAARDLGFDGRPVSNVQLDLLDAGDSHRQSAVGSDDLIPLGDQGFAQRPAQFAASPGHKDSSDGITHGSYSRGNSK